MKQSIYTLLFFLSSCFVLQAQDPIFSQYLSDPIGLNPALTGVIPHANTRNRLAILYRDQWRKIPGRTTFQTSTASFDTRFCAPNGDFWGLGLRFLNDIAGIYPFTRNNLHFTFSYGILMHKDRYSGTQGYLVGGFEGGLIHNQINDEDFQFDEQFNSNTLLFDQGIPGETFDNLQSLMPDVGGGLAYFHVRSDPTESAYSLGISVKHINQPKYNFFENNEDSGVLLQRRVSLFANATIGLIPGEFALMPKLALFIQEPYTQFNFGSDFFLPFLQNKGTYNLKVGIFARTVRWLEEDLNFDAMIIRLELDIDALSVVAGYDLSISNVRKASLGNSAIELGLQYYFTESRYCPRNCPEF